MARPAPPPRSCQFARGPERVVAGPPDRDGPVREQLSALRSMLVLAMLLTQQDSQDSILHYVANAVESLGSCTTEGIFLDGLWQDVRIADRKATSLPAVVNAADGGPITLLPAGRLLGRQRGTPRSSWCGARNSHLDDAPATERSAACGWPGPA